MEERAKLATLYGFEVFFFTKKSLEVEEYFTRAIITKLDEHP